MQSMSAADQLQKQRPSCADTETRSRGPCSIIPSPENTCNSWEARAFAEDASSLTAGIWPPRAYPCSFCRREFRSAQALGGHMNVHRRDRARMRHHSPPRPPFFAPSSLIESPRYGASRSAEFAQQPQLVTPPVAFKPPCPYSPEVKKCSSSFATSFPLIRLQQLASEAAVSLLHFPQPCHCADLPLKCSTSITNSAKIECQCAIPQAKPAPILEKTMVVANYPTLTGKSRARGLPWAASVTPSASQRDTLVTDADDESPKKKSHVTSSLPCSHKRSANSSQTEKIPPCATKGDVEDTLCLLHQTSQGCDQLYVDLELRLGP